MSAIVYNTKFDFRRLRSAAGDIGTVSLKPGMLVLGKDSEGTVYVINNKLEKQPINYAGFMKYYAAPGSNPFAGVTTISIEQLNTIPQGSLITDQTAPANVSSAASLGSNKLLLYGAILIAIVIAYNLIAKKKSA